jgi:DNA-binding transcriptional LysR family regulator
MDRLTVMNSFVAVVKAESFVAAARSLGVSASLVSRHIADLEDQLGVRLVNRTARTVTLTEHGQRYYEFSQRVLREVAAEDASIRSLSDRAEGSLSIVAPKWIGSLDVSDAITAFAAAHPLIKVSFDVGGMSDRTYDFIEQGYDLAFHTKDLRDSSIKARRVATLPFVLCASPEYLQRHAAPKTIADLANHACLIHRNEPVWHLVDQQGRTHHHRVLESAFTSNTYLILQKAALEGLGIALLPLRPSQLDIRDGRLQVILADHTAPERPLYVVYAPGMQKVQKLRTFLDFTAEWFKRSPVDEDLVGDESQVAPLAASV